MLVTELGFLVTLLIGVALGFIGFAILNFWIQLFDKNFDSNSKFFWPLFVIHQIIWIIGVCVIPYKFVNDYYHIWAWPFIIYFFGSLIVMAVTKIFRSK